MGCTRSNIAGQKFGELTAIEYVGDREYPCGKKLSMWKCVCSCGNETTVSLSALRTGNTKSCGCLNEKNLQLLSQSRIKHGDADSRLYMVWEQMRKRCKNKNDRSYKFYGAKGVSVCEEWDNDYGSFMRWSMENGYDPSAKRGECTLDRINPYGNYEPDNCRWIPLKEQFKNLRRHWKDGADKDGNSNSHPLEATH